MTSSAMILRETLNLVQALRPFYRVNPVPSDELYPLTKAYERAVSQAIKAAEAYLQDTQSL